MNQSARELPTTPQTTHDRTASTIRTLADVKLALTHLFDDENKLNDVAREFHRLGLKIAGREASAGERAEVFRQYIEQLPGYISPAEASAEDTRDGFWRVLEEMRAEHLRVSSSFEARAARVEIEGASDARLSLRELYEPSNGRTRAEHASHLNSVSPDARDLYERGATLYDDVLVIPRESVGKSAGADQVHIGSHAHAVRTFAPLIGEEAREVAVEFVEAGRAIAGRTADGNSRLAVFRTFYKEITHDSETGRFRTPSEQAAQIEPVLERMRLLSSVMRAQEWKRDRTEFIAVEDWERGLESRQRDAENEAHGRLTYRIESIAGLEDADAEERAEDERERITSRLPEVAFERIPLSREPPRLPDALSEREERRLRYEIVPRIDRQLEAGARPRDIKGWLYREQQAETLRARDEQATRIFAARDPAANTERAVTRAEELRAFYVLRTLFPEGERFREQRVGVEAEIAARAPSMREQAETIDNIGTELAREYRAMNRHLESFTAAETERERLTDEARAFQESVRVSAEFQELKRRLAEGEHERALDEREALTRGNNALVPKPPPPPNLASNYPELTGEQPPLSSYARLRRDHEQARTNARNELADLLINPEIEQAQERNAAEIERQRAYFSQVTSREIESSNDARAALEPTLARTRAALHRLHDERAELNIEKTRIDRQHQSPLFVSFGAGDRPRLPLTNLNEYRTFVSLARKSDVPIRAFASFNGREITGESAARSELYDFARDYTTFRSQDDATRLLNENRLLREFKARLDKARTVDELRASLNDIRRENYDRSAHSERYAQERGESLRQGEQARHPLNTSEMRGLLLSTAPAHYTDEMRHLRVLRSQALTDKTERVRRLEQGTIEPSPTLETILREFERTRSESPARYVRNIKSFLGDYLNPPAPNRNRFSRENLYELGSRLEPAESDYLFKLVSETREALERGVPIKTLALSERLSRAETPDRALPPSSTSTGGKPRSPFESRSFRLYYGASLWREAEALTEARRRSDGEKNTPARERREGVSGIGERDLVTIAALLASYAKQPKMLEAAAEHLRASGSHDGRRLAEIVRTFGEMKVSSELEGQLRLQITMRADSSINREDWERLLGVMPSRIHEAQALKLSDSQHKNLRRDALAAAWHDIEPRETPAPELEQGHALQVRALLAADALEDHVAQVASKVSAQLTRAGDLHSVERSEIERLTRLALTSSSQRSVARVGDSLDSKRDADTRVEPIIAAIARTVTERDRGQYGMLSAYAARTKSEYLENFRLIDEKVAVLDRAPREKALEAVQREARDDVRGVLEERVSNYLNEVVRERGIAALLPHNEGTRHAGEVARIISETFSETGRDFSASPAGVAHVRAAAAKLVGELPAALEERRREIFAATTREHQLGEIQRRDYLLPPKAAEIIELPAAVRDERENGRNVLTLAHNADDEIVEQKVKATVGRIHEPSRALLDPLHKQQSQAAREPKAHELVAEHHDQHAHRYVFTR